MFSGLRLENPFPVFLSGFPPFPVDELLQKLTELMSAVNTGKDSL